MTYRMRQLKILEREFLNLYSAWQESHELILVDQCMTLLGKILRLNPQYSIRHSFERAF